MFVLISPDLMVQSRVAAAAERAGIAPPRVAEWHKAPSILDTDRVDFVLLDLSVPGLRIEELLPAIRERMGDLARVIAFGPHVQKGKLEAARRAGCDLVISRGQLDREIDSLLVGSSRGGD